ncbi:uncharacterized protein BXZ73DRAFT_102377 [Epithele typhae]|uniref:uncharacterized protein n=1 Tax=Epithele typhae TaxID=378194 RepID=UPI002008B12F|nr:uncharacterized protein BXZ73DRAFT_102377 [Epithele typhae]KAH9928541.1 hypothetical protein BXZ73DRAFT_102377 [Epithele typhae]
MPAFPVQCAQCQELFRSQASFDEMHRPETGHSSVFICLECFDTFDNDPDRRQHMLATRHRPPLGIWSALAASRGMAELEPGETTAAPPPTEPAPAGPSSPTPTPPTPTLVPNPTPTPAPPQESRYMCPTCMAPFRTRKVSRPCVVLAPSPVPVCADAARSTPLQHIQRPLLGCPRAAHPKCKPCGRGFVDEAARLTHKVDCPISPSRAAGKRPATARPPWSNSPQAATPATPPPQPPVVEQPSLPSVFSMRIAEEEPPPPVNGRPTAAFGRTNHKWRALGLRVHRVSLQNHISLRGVHIVVLGATAQRQQPLSQGVPARDPRHGAVASRPATPDDPPPSAVRRGPGQDPLVALQGLHAGSVPGAGDHGLRTRVLPQVSDRSTHCFLRELDTKMCCPVCKTLFLVRLHVALDV